MGRIVGIGIQDFEKIIKNNYFYVDHPAAPVWQDAHDEYAGLFFFGEK